MSDQLSYGFLLVIAGNIFAALETAIFGFNMFPQSGSELLCDLIALVIILLGVHAVLTSKESKRYFKK